MMKINITKRLNRFLAVAGAMLIGTCPGKFIDKGRSQ